MLSNAISSDRVSRIVGYILTKGFFNEVSPNLPQRIVVIGEANDANQSGLNTSPIQLTSAQQVGSLFGYGSPLYHIARILRPILGGDGIGSIPTVFIAQSAAVGATAKVMTVTAIGVATQNVTHYLRIAGRTGMDGVDYAINIVAGDNSATIATKIANAINNVIGSPVLAQATGYNVILTSKWKGLTANELTVSVDTGTPEVSAGLTYSITTSQAGSGTPSIAPALNFNEDWNTIVINSYGLVSSVLSALETYNGIPDPNTPTGRYAGLIMKPFIAITGSVLDDPSSLTDGRLNDVTIAVAPAPNSPAFAFEAAANMAYLFALQAQNNPELDVAGLYYPDMPTPVLDSQFGSMAIFTNRDTIVKKGCSTVSLEGGAYRVQDFVTTYHPVGENPPAYRYCRNLNVDFNVKYGYYLLQDANVLGHVIAKDDDIVNVDKVVKPKTWKAEIYSYAEDLTSRGLTVDADFMQQSIQTQLSSTNPDRLDTFFRYKRSGFARQAATTAQAGFNFGSI